MKSLSMLLSVLCLAVVVMTGSGQEKDKKKGDGLKSKLIGEWRYVSGVDKGMKMPREMLEGPVKFTRDKVTVPAGKGKEFVIDYTLNEKTKPAQIDMDIKEGPAKGKALGIIELKGGELKLCYVPSMGKKAKRPSSFESTKENGAMSFVLKRAR